LGRRGAENGTPPMAIINRLVVEIVDLDWNSDSCTVGVIVKCPSARVAFELWLMTMNMAVIFSD